jgi:hypothetical protein
VILGHIIFFFKFKKKKNGKINVGGPAKQIQKLLWPKRLMFLPGYGPIAIADWSIIVQCHPLVKYGFWRLFGAVVEMGVLSILKRLLTRHVYGVTCGQIIFPGFSRWFNVLRKLMPDQ